jgi:hypothetical protein
MKDQAGIGGGTQGRFSQTLQRLEAGMVRRRWRKLRQNQGELVGDTLIQQR